MHPDLEARHRAWMEREARHAERRRANGSLPDKELGRKNGPERPIAARREEPSLPPLGRQIAGLAGAVGRAAVARGTGRPVVAPPEVIEARTAICRACDHYRASDGRCGGRKTGCGCFVAIKSTLASERCPLDPPRWGRYEGPGWSPRHSGVPVQ